MAWPGRSAPLAMAARGLLVRRERPLFWSSGLPSTAHGRHARGVVWLLVVLVVIMHHPGRSKF